MDFNFVRNDDLRSVIERDYRALEGLNPENETKAVLVLAGGILEGLLIDALTVAGKWDFDSACQQNLSDMIGPATAKGIIRSDNLSRVLKECRHLIHPGREIRNRVRLTKDDAELALIAVRLTIREVSEWYSTSSGKAASELKRPTATVPPEQQRSFLRASDHSIDVRITAALGSTFMIFVTNNSDETFDIRGAVVEFEGATLGSIARPQPGITWTSLPGKGLDLRWPDNCTVMFDLVRRRGRFEMFQYIVALDIIFLCVLDDEQREIRKRVAVQIDPVNKAGIQV